MFTGTTIDELIESVERAEQHARRERPEPPFTVPEMVSYQNANWQGLVEVA